VLVFDTYLVPHEELQDSSVTTRNICTVTRRQSKGGMRGREEPRTTR